MSRQVRLAPVGYQRQFVAEEPAPPAQLRVRADDCREFDGLDEDLDDNLRPARGILAGLLLGAGMWSVIALLVWLILR